MQGRRAATRFPSVCDCTHWGLVVSTRRPMHAHSCCGATRCSCSGWLALGTDKQLVRSFWWVCARRMAMARCVLFADAWEAAGAATVGPWRPSPAWLCLTPRCVILTGFCRGWGYGVEALREAACRGCLWCVACPLLHFLLLMACVCCTPAAPLCVPDGFGGEAREGTVRRLVLHQ